MDTDLITKVLLNYADSSDSQSISSSSDESSDTSDDELVVLAAYKNKRNCIKTYLEEVVPKYTDAEFVMHFRVPRIVYQMLCEKIKISEQFQSFEERKLYSAEMHIGLFLWFAGHEACSIRDLGDRFDVSIRTASRIIERVTYFISGLPTTFIKWPNDEEKRATSEYIKNKTGIDGVIGAIDGTHIKVDMPKEVRNYYIDRKNTVSIQMQGICNEKKKFIDMFVGFPGSAHDNRVFENSDIYPNLPASCGQYFILGDSAYACSNYVVTPYRDNGHLSANQKYFNRKHSSGRVMIEHTFGLLKQRFRQLYYCKLRGIEKLCHFVRACVVLHNLCDDSLEVFDAEPAINSDADQGTIPFVRDGALRNRLCEELSAQR